jgi:hypothetical protein
MYLCHYLILREQNGRCYVKLLKLAFVPFDPVRHCLRADKACNMGEWYINGIASVGWL